MAVSCIERKQGWHSGNCSHLPAKGQGQCPTRRRSWLKKTFLKFQSDLECNGDSFVGRKIVPGILFTKQTMNCICSRKKASHAE